MWNRYNKTFKKRPRSYDNVIAIAPDRCSYHRKAHALYELGNYQEAIDECDKVIAIKPDFIDSYRSLEIVKKVPKFFFVSCSQRSF